MKTVKHLPELSKHTARPMDFDALIGILDQELRLITPTEPDDALGI